MKRKVVAIALILVLAISMLGIVSASAEEVNLRMWTFLNLTSTNGRAIVLGKLIKEFEASHPGVTITVETQEWSTLSAKVIAAHAAGNAPDIYMVNSENLGATLAAGCFEPLENLFCKDWNEAEFADVDSAMWNAGFDGQYHYQVPCFYTVYGIYYRSDLFEKFGINADDIETWDDLAEAAKKLTFVDDNGVKVYGLGTGYGTAVTDPQGYLPAVLASKEGGMFTEDGHPNDWSGEVGQAALQYQLDLIDVYGVDSPSSVAISQEELYNAFEAGQYAMIFGGSVRVPTVKSLSAFDPNYVQFMGNRAMTEGGEKCTTSVAGWHIGVWNGSKNKEIAGEFLGSLITNEADTMWVTEANQIPLRKSTMEKNTDVFMKPENAWMTVVADIVANHSYAHPTKFVVKSFSLDLQTAMIRAYVDKISPKEALEEAEASFIARNINR